MNKKQLNHLEKALSISRKEIRLQNTQLQKNMVEQLELAMCKMLEYIQDQSDFLKSYVSELREIPHSEFSTGLLDALNDVIIQFKKDTTVIRRAYEDAKIQLKPTDNLEEVNLIVFHSTELNELVRGLDRLEKVLLTYPISQG